MFRFVYVLVILILAFSVFGCQGTVSVGFQPNWHGTDTQLESTVRNRPTPEQKPNSWEGWDMGLRNH